MCTPLVGAAAAPTITCPAPLSFSNVSAGSITMAVYYATPTWSDNSGVLQSLICAPASGALFTIPGALVTCTATDQINNQATCSFQVTLVESTKPTCTCPSSQTISLTTGYNYTVLNYMPNATDVHGVLAVQCTPVSGSTFFLGTTTPVSCFSQNYAGLLWPTCTFTRAIVATPTPTITCPADQAIACYNGATPTRSSPRATLRRDTVDAGSSCAPAASRLAVSSHLATQPCRAR